MFRFLAIDVAWLNFWSNQDQNCLGNSDIFYFIDIRYCQLLSLLTLDNGSNVDRWIEIGPYQAEEAHVCGECRLMQSDERTIVCYGDLNTYGLPPIQKLGDFSRYDRKTRWPRVMADRLGDEFHVIEEGLCARTTTHTDPVEGEDRNGLASLGLVLESHMPIETVVLMLGSNDLKARFGVTAFEISMSIQRLILAIQRSTTGPAFKAPGILLVSPPPIYERSFLTEMFKGGREKSLQLAEHLSRVATTMGTAFFDAGSLVDGDTEDGVHLTAASHRILGVALADKLLQMHKAL